MGKRVGRPDYRLSAVCVNGKQGTANVVDPFNVQPGWFELDLETYFVHAGSAAPVAEHARITQTLLTLNLRQCVQQRGQYITMYHGREITLQQLER